ncbi:DNA cytosine methyltransferase [Candidatus Phytoplasma solani]|uniref:DNA cytosine methyltransferase n=1 Tax=Candidatus Phytoplasma solani TaxID=69896 RepID=UPI00359026DD
MNNKNTYISLFSSAGIGCYGFKKENFQCLATNEFLSKRMEIQKNNKVCVNDEGYILGDIRENKDKILDIVKKHGKQITIVIATPPCQGISTLNQKKNSKEILRNSLVVESVDLIKKIKPKFFILENVALFLKTACINSKKQTITIEKLIEEELSSQYNFHAQVINFKNYGSNSSRRRTLIIGVEHSITKHITPLELFPDFTEEKPLSCVLQQMKSLEWGEFDADDFYHQFRIYPKHMREWIKDLKPGKSAFENDEIHKKPHRIINNQIVINKNSLGKKYSRAYWDKVAPCIHTRSDCMASQHTIHPFDDRVFSIREIMKMMTIPKDFRWIDSDLSDLNKLTLLEKKTLLKKHETNIRQSIGESVPTIIFQQIARKINIFLNKKILNASEIKSEIKNHNLYIFENLKKYIIEKKIISMKLVYLL